MYTCSGNGREDGILEALRISDDFITNRETYAWWKANLKVYFLLDTQY